MTDTPTKPLVLATVDLSHPAQHKAILTKAAAMAAMDAARLAVLTVIPDFGMTIVGSFFEAGAEKKALTAAGVLLHEIVDTVLGQDAGKASNISCATALPMNKSSTQPQC
jgi:hypothetical protein